jgi:outer membrane murein-binding lipoprotein Lpp
MKRWPVAIIVAVVLLLAGCSKKSDRPAVRTASERSVTDQVDQLARQITATAHGGDLTAPRTNASACDTDAGDTSGTVVFVQSAYNMSLAHTKHKQAFESAHQHWEGMGWRIKEWWFKDATNQGSLIAADPASGEGFTLSSTKSPDHLAVIVQSGCFRSTGPG